MWFTLVTHFSAVQWGKGIGWVLVLPWVGGSQDHHQVWWFTRRTHRSPCLVMITIMIYYRKRCSAQSAKGKEICNKSLGDQMQSSKCPLPVDLHRMCLLRHCDDTCKMLSTRELIRDSMPEVLLGAAHRGSLCVDGTVCLNSQKESRCSDVLVIFLGV